MIKKTIKKKYVPCQLDVVEFKVERGFAASGEQAVGSPFTQQGTTNVLWSMTHDGNQNFRNMESYEEQTFDW